MKINISNIRIILLGITIIVINSCNNSQAPLVYNAELLFVNSFKINVEPYNYINSDSTEFYQVFGDSAVVADTFSSMPEFQWSNNTAGFLTVAISKEPFMVSDKNIINTDQIVWQWQPGMESGEYGKVAYLDGKAVKNKKILYDTQPLPLESGLYYWAVWSWDYSGREIVYSTKALKMHVK